jgi:hypothetical protein
MLVAPRPARDCAVESGDLSVEEVDVAQAPGDRFALVIGQRERDKPATAGRTEEVADWWAPFSVRMTTAWISFFARVRAHELAASDQPPTPARATRGLRRTDGRTTISALGCTGGRAWFSCNSSGMITLAGWQLCPGGVARKSR